MTNETIGIISVFACTGVLFLLRHLILSVGQPRRKVTANRTAEVARRNLRAVVSDREVEHRESQAHRVILHNHPGTFPR